MKRILQAIKPPLLLVATAAATFSLAVMGLTAPATAAEALLPGPAPIEQRASTGATADNLPTVQIDSGVVWNQQIVGNIVYAGGSFSNARPAGAAPGTNLIPRSNILAFDIRTGQITSFAPVINGTVKSIAVSPDGKKLYVGGTFNQVNGQTRWNLAAFDVATGTLDAGFKAAVGGSYVNAIAATDTAVYTAGLIGAGNGVVRKGFAAFNTAGALLGWAPTADLQVDAMVLTPQKDKLIAGGRFGAVNGVTQRGLAALDLSTGALLPWEAPNIVKNGVSTGSGAGKAGIWGLSTDQNAVYGTGWVFADVATGNLEGTFSAEPGDGSIRWIADCHGDHYGVYSDGTTVYTTSHEHACESMGGIVEKQPENMRNATATTAAPKGTLSRSPWVNNIYKDWSGYPAPAAVDWFPDWYTGKATGMGQAGFSIVGGNGYISVGGEFVGVNGQSQQGLVRFSSNPPGGPKQGPRLSASTWTPTARSVMAGTARIAIRANWDRDDLALTYKLMRVGTPTPVATTTVNSTYWNLPNVTLTDSGRTPGSSQSYYVVATDANGNSAQSAQVAVQIADGSASPYVGGVLTDDPALFWPLGGAADAAGADYAGSNDGTSGSGVGTTPNGGGAISGDPAPASTFNGEASGFIASNQPPTVGAEYSTEIWFKTTTGRGGKIMGYGSGKTGSSSSYDRHVYMLDNGQLTFGTYPGQTKTVTSSASFNDGTWHHAVASQSAAGMVLYVDGAVVGADPQTTTAQSYTGFWRVGGDNLSGWPNRPSSDYFNGSLDNFATYGGALTASQVTSHYAMGSGQGTPTASFTSAGAGLTVAFDGSASTAPAGQTITSHSWNFGDGSAAGSGETVDHSYTASGNYNVVLTVTTGAGVSATSTQTVTVTAPPGNQAPVAAFISTVEGLSVTVDGSSSVDGDGSVASYAWDFGDTATAPGRTARHVYAAAGTYTVTLTVTDNQGLASAAVNATVTVDAAPPANVLAKDNFGRSVTNGWGAADEGGPWALTGGASMFSVSGGAGKIALPPGSTRFVNLSGVSSTNTDATVSVALSSVPTGSGNFVTLIGRQVGSSKYALQSWFKADGSVALSLLRDSTTLELKTVPGLAYSANMVLNLRLEVTGTSPTTVRGKIWKDGDAEPAAWQSSRTDNTPALQSAGNVGLGDYLSGSATSPVTTSFSKLLATAGGAAVNAAANQVPVADLASTSVPGHGNAAVTAAGRWDSVALPTKNTASAAAFIRRGVARLPGADAATSPSSGGAAASPVTDTWLT